MKRAERHHLKQDEFVHWLDHVLAWGMTHQKNLINGGLVIVGAALLLGGLSIHRSRQSATAQVLLTEALRQYHGVVRSGDGALPSSNVITFATKEEKYGTALESFEAVANEYSGYDEGRQAQYYVALCQMGLSDLEAADGSLETVRSNNRDLIWYLASRALASVRSERGDPAAAGELYRSLVEDADNPLPKDELLYALAKLEERSGNLEQARQYYDRMLSEHPASQLSLEATTRREILLLSLEGDANVSD